MIGPARGAAVAPGREGAHGRPPETLRCAPRGPRRAGPAAAARGDARRRLGRRPGRRAQGGAAGHAARAGDAATARQDDAPRHLRGSGHPLGHRGPRAGGAAPPGGSATQVGEWGSAPKRGRHSTIRFDPRWKLCLSSAHLLRCGSLMVRQCTPTSGS